MPDPSSEHRDIATEKRRIRKAALEIRAEAKAVTGPLAGDLLMAQFLENITLPPQSTVAGYWPMNDEISPVPLLKRLFKDGFPCSLPAVLAKGEALTFRDWRPDMELEDGPFGTSHPPSNSDVVTPGVLLVPMLAFDGHGYRVGYGGGYYDRTLIQMKTEGVPVLAVGMAYESQRVEAAPTGSLDQRLDWVITENGAHQFT